MSNNVFSSNKEIDVLIIGAGPAGLAAATELKRLGVERVIVLERESEAGGVPRHCGHPPFGMREFKRILTGPRYAKKLVKVALKAGVEIYTSINVVELKKLGCLLITSDNGVKEISAKRIIYATGVRETPRSARLISGVRTRGIINTGTLQQMVFLKKLAPFKRPVIIGSELVAFSAILTCRHAKIKPVAMIEADNKTIAQFPLQYCSPLLGVPLHLNSKLIKIIGDKQVSAIEIENGEGEKQILECDGVILSGNFTPEATLAHMGHLEIDNATGGVKIDQFGRCSDPVYFAAGNVLRPVETSGWCWQEGKNIAKLVAMDLNNKLLLGEQYLIINAGKNVKFAAPQKIYLTIDNSKKTAGMSDIQLRFPHAMTGRLILRNSNGVIYSKRKTVSPEKRLLIPIASLDISKITLANNQVEVIFEEA